MMRFCDAAYPNRFPNSHISRNGSVSWQNQRRNYRRCNTFRLYAAFHYTHSIPCLCCGDRIDIFHHRRNRRKCHTGDAGWSSNIPSHHKNTSRETCPSQRPRRSPGKFLPNHIHPTTYRYCCAGRTYLLRNKMVPIHGEKRSIPTIHFHHLKTKRQRFTTKSPEKWMR